VGVNSDESIARCKGPPLMNDAERLTMVEACKFVDQVVPDCPYVMTSEYLDYIFETYDVDYVVHGDDPCIVDGKDVYASAKRRGRYRSIPRTEGVSTTDIVGRMLLMTKEHHLRTKSRRNLHVRGSSFGCQSDLLLVAPPPPPRDDDVDSDNEIHNDDEGGDEVARMMGDGDDVSVMSAVNFSEDGMGNVGRGVFLGHQSKFLTTSMMLRLFSADVKPPEDGMRVIYVDGAWDMFHCGHVEFLKEVSKVCVFPPFETRFSSRIGISFVSSSSVSRRYPPPISLLARMINLANSPIFCPRVWPFCFSSLTQRGDYVIVGIHGDSAVNKRRGGNLPLMNLHERLLSVLGCKFTNDVLIDAPLEITPDMIASLRITEVVHGTESDHNGGDVGFGTMRSSSLSVQLFFSEFYIPCVPSSILSLPPFFDTFPSLREDDRYRYPREMGIFRTVNSPSDFKLENIVSRIQKKHAELQRKIDRKKKAEREWFENKYQNGDKNCDNGGNNH
jgi:glycerol-3-phosphate cytidylyltransferase-like family protein